MLLYSLDMQRSAPDRYLNTAAGWLVLLRHHAIRRLRTALPEGEQDPSSVISGYRNLARMPACCVCAQNALVAPGVIDPPLLERVAERSTSPHLATELFAVWPDRDWLRSYIYKAAT